MINVGALSYELLLKKDKFDSDIDKAQTSIKDLVSTAEKSDRTFSTFSGNLVNVGDTAQQVANNVDKVGDAVKKAGDSTSQTEKEFEKFDQALSNIKDKAVDLSKVLLGITTAAAGAAAALGGVALNSAQEFQSSLANINTVLRLSEKDLANFGKQTLELSTRVPVPGSVLNGALYDIVSAGITDASNSLKVLEASAKLGVAGLGSTGEAANIMTSALNAFGISASESARVADVLFKTVEVGKTTISELSQSFGQVAPIAKVAGVSFEELQAATAALTTAGFQTSVAQNALKGVFQELSDEGNKLDKAFAKVGIQNVEASIKSRGFVETLQLLKDKAHLSDIELKNLFGRVEAGGAVVALLGEQNKIFTQSMTKMTKEANSLESAFDIQMQTFASAGQILQNKFNKVLIEAGTRVLPVLTNALGKLSDFFDKNSAAIGRAVEAFANFASQLLGGIIGAVESFVNAIASSPTAIYELAGALTAALIPAVVSLVASLGPAVLAIGALAVAGAAIGKMVGDVANAIDADAKRNAVGTEKLMQNSEILKNEGVKNIVNFSHDSSEALREWSLKGGDFSEDLKNRINDNILKTKEISTQGISEMVEQTKGELEKLKTAGLIDEGQFSDLVKQNEEASKKRIEIQENAAKRIQEITEGLNKKTIADEGAALKELDTLRFQVTQNAIENKVVERDKLQELNAVIAETAKDIQTEQVADIAERAIKAKDEKIKIAEEEYQGQIGAIDRLVKDGTIKDKELKDHALKLAKENKDKLVKEATETTDKIVAEAKRRATEQGRTFDEQKGRLLTHSEEGAKKLQELDEKVSKAFSDFVVNLGKFVAEFFIGVGKIFEGIALAVSKGLVDAYNAVLKWAGDSQVAVQTWIDETITGIGKWASDTYNSIVTWVSNTAAAISQWVSDRVNDFVTWVTETLANITTFVTEAPGKIAEFIATTAAGIAGWVSEQVNNFAKWASESLDKIIKFASEAPGKIIDFIVKTAASIATWVGEQVGKFAQWASESLGKLGQFAAEAPGKIGKFITDTATAIGKWVTERVKDFTDFITKGAAALATGVTKFFAEAVKWGGSILSALITLPIQLFTAGVNAVAGFIKGLASQLFAVKKTGVAIAQAAAAAIKSKQGLDEHSPSKVMEELGNFAAEGFIIGLANKAPEVQAGAVKLVAGLKAEMAKAAKDKKDLNFEGAFNEISKAVDDSFKEASDAVRKFASENSRAQEEIQRDLDSTQKKIEDLTESFNKNTEKAQQGFTNDATRIILKAKEDQIKLEKEIASIEQKSDEAALKRAADLEQAQNKLIELQKKQKELQTEAPEKAVQNVSAQIKQLETQLSTLKSTLVDSKGKELDPVKKAADLEKIQNNINKLKAQEKAIQTEKATDKDPTKSLLAQIAEQELMIDKLKQEGGETEKLLDLKKKLADTAEILKLQDDKQIVSSEQLAEAERQAALNPLEALIEKFEKEKAEREKQFQSELQELEKRKQVLQQSLAERQAEFQNFYSAVTGQDQAFTEIIKSETQKREAIQLESINKLIAEYEKLAAARKGLADKAGIPGFEEGGLVAAAGYTADIGSKKVAGVVHGGEWVAPKWMVNAMPNVIGSLEAIRLGKNSPSNISQNNSKTVNIHVTNNGTDQTDFWRNKIHLGWMARYYI